MRLVFAFACALLLAGCTRPAPLGVGDAEAAHAGVACPSSQLVSAFDANGTPRCAPPNAAFRCAPNAFVNGFDDAGRPTCAPGPAFPTQTAATLPKVINIYGVRNDTTRPGVWDVKLVVEVPAGAAPLDAGNIIVRFAHANETHLASFSAGPLADAAPAASVFAVSWIRGAGGGTLRAGDLVEVHLNANGPEIETQRTVEMAIVTPTGTVRADFKTPATYASDTVVTLR